MEMFSNYTSPQGQTIQVRFEPPKNCPICNVLMLATFSGCSHNPTTKELMSVFQCTNPDCKSYFIGYYKESGQPGIYSFIKTEPPNLTTTAFPDFINEVSPMFLTLLDEVG